MSELRFLATGDTQIHPWKQFSYTMPNGMNSRLYHCLEVFKILRLEAKRRKIKKILINGDIFEVAAEIQTEVYDATYRAVEKLHWDGIQVVFNLGNHDIVRQNGKKILHCLRPFEKIAEVITIPQPIWGQLTIIPWMPDPEQLKKEIKIYAKHKGRLPHGLILHCGVQGARTGPKAHLIRNPIKVEDLFPDQFAFVALSDYHTQQSLAKNVFYLGSPLQHSFGETHSPCIWEIVLHGSMSSPTYRTEKIHTNLPEFKSIHLQDLAFFKKNLHRFYGHYVKVILTEDSEVRASEIMALADGKFLVQIERESSKTEAFKFSNHLASPEEALSAYVEDVLSIGTRMYRERIKDLGKKILKGQ